MKVTCSYCDSYVEANETATCPICGAPLSDAIRAAEAEAEAQKAEAAEQAAKTAEVQAKEQTKQTVISAAAGILGAAAGSLLGKSLRGGNGMPPRHGRGGPEGPDRKGPGDGASEHGRRGHGNRGRGR